MNTPHRFAILTWLQPALLLALVVALIINWTYMSSRLRETDAHLADLGQTVSRLSTSIASSTSDLATALAQAQTNINNVRAEQRQNVNAIQQQVSSVTGSVSTLEKLSRTDPQLLAKYSKVYFLNENYVPARLAEIPADYEYSTNKQLTIHTDVLPFIEHMIDDASSTGVHFYAFSAYRSFAEQKALKGEYTMMYGAGTANSFSADQGYSEHQLGTALDFIAPGQGGVLDGFDKTAAYSWMLMNAYKYGFILSYPKGNGYYVYEPWHWRYVGVKLATDLHAQGKNFYDLDQRTIDTYLVTVFP